MNNYETMFIIKPDLGNEARDHVVKDITGMITKNSGKIVNQQIWAEKRKLAYSIKKYQDGTYYLLQFDIAASEIAKLKESWRLNENILRCQILNIGR